MIFKFDFKHQLKLPTLVFSKLHSTGSLSPTVRHEASGFFQIKTHITYMKTKSDVLHWFELSQPISN